MAFRYDYLGRRVQKKRHNWVNGQWPATPALDRKYVWSGWLMLLELNGLSDDAVVHKYTWGLDLAGQSGAQSGAPTSGRSTLERAGTIGGVLVTYDTNGTSGTGGDRAFVYLHDGNGNVKQVISSAGPIQGTMTS